MAAISTSSAQFVTHKLNSSDSNSFVSTSSSEPIDNKSVNVEEASWYWQIACSVARVAKPILYNAALLAPKLILSGAGWVVGFGVAGPVGAAVGDAIGTYLGCMISMGIEIAILKYLKDPLVEDWEHTKALMKDRIISALILSTGSLFGGFAFSYALEYIAPLVSSDFFVQALITGAIAATVFAAGMTIARTVYSFTASAPKDQHKLSLENLFQDSVCTSFFIIFPAQVTFVATALPVFGATWLLGGPAVIKGAASVAIGGLIGYLAQLATKAAMEKRLWEHIEMEQFASEKGRQELYGSDPIRLLQASTSSPMS